MVTAAIVAVNGLLAEAWISYWGQKSGTSGWPQLLGIVAIFVIGLSAIGGWLYSRPLGQAPDASLKVGIIQGNVPTRIKLSAAGVRRAIEGYVSGYEMLSAQGVDAVLTPEGALPLLWNGQAASQNPFHQAVVEQKVVAWLGTFFRQDDHITQSLLTLTKQGEVFSRYNKIKLVPLGEYIPFQEILGAVIGRLSPIKTSMQPGTSAQRFDTPFGRAIASICYESAFPALFRAQAASGGEFILTASNLDPYSEVLMAQHEAQDMMRAIETDRWAVRATNTGYSGVIDPHGRIVWRSRPQEYQIHADVIDRRQTQTLYVRWGDWLTPLLIGLSGIWIGVSTWLRTKSKSVVRQ
jgi:apolipoprotein N-acyltransferase